MSKLKLDLHDIYNQGDKIDAALENTLREAGTRCRKWEVESRMWKVGSGKWEVGRES